MVLVSRLQPLTKLAKQCRSCGVSPVAFDRDGVSGQTSTELAKQCRWCDV